MEGQTGESLAAATAIIVSNMQLYAKGILTADAPHGDLTYFENFIDGLQEKQV